MHRSVRLTTVLAIGAGLLSTAALPSAAVAMPAAHAAAVAAEAAAPASGIGIRLLDIPAATQSDPRARSYIVDRLQPGATIERRVQVQNDTDSTQTVRIYPGAAHIEGGAFVGEEADAANELTSWVGVEQPEIQLAAGATGNVAVTIDVPDDAAEGERYGAVWAEIRAPKDEATNIVSASRAGIRVYLSVGPGNGAAAGFEITSLTSVRDDAGAPAVVAAVTNTGGRAVDLSGRLSLSEGPSGLSAGPFDTDAMTTVAPGESGEVTVTLDSGLPDGPWHAMLQLESGLLSQTAEADLTFPLAAADTGETVQPEGGPDAVLIGVAIAAVLAVAAAVWFIVGRRRPGGRR